MKRWKPYWRWLRSAFEKPSRFTSPPDEMSVFIANTYLLFWAPFVILLISAINSWWKGDLTAEVVQAANIRFAKPDYIISFSNNLILISTLGVTTALSYLAYLYRKPTRKHYALPSAAILLLFWSLFSSLLAGMAVFYIDIDPVTSKVEPKEAAGLIAYCCCLNSVTSFTFAYIYLVISVYMTQVLQRQNPQPDESAFIDAGENNPIPRSNGKHE